VIELSFGIELQIGLQLGQIFIEKIISVRVSKIMIVVRDRIMIRAKIRGRVTITVRITIRIRVRVRV